MSAHGRTSWWGKDAAYNDRELIVELGEEFGPGGPLVMDELSCLAQAQSRGIGNGEVLTGYRSLARKAFIGVDLCRQIVAHAANIGALDDLVPGDDGRRFTCRVSGWRADQVRAREAWRKAQWRAGRDDHETETEERSGDSEGLSREEPPLSQKGTSRPQPDQTRPDQEEQIETAPTSAAPPLPELPKVTYNGKRVDPDTVMTALRLLGVFNEATGRDLGATTGDGKASPMLKQIVGAMRVRPNVSADQWEAAVRRTVASPPDWVHGQLQLGHVFGERAAEHALAEGPTNGSGREPRVDPAMAAKYGGRVQ